MYLEYTVKANTHTDNPSFLERFPSTRHHHDATLTWLAHDGAWLQLQHHGNEGDVCGVEDLCAVRQGNCPQLRRWVEHMEPSFAAGHLWSVTLTNQVCGVANDSIACLRLGTLLHLDRHHIVVAQVNDGNIPILNEVRVLHKTHREHGHSGKRRRAYLKGIFSFYYFNYTDVVGWSLIWHISLNLKL